MGAVVRGDIFWERQVNIAARAAERNSARARFAESLTAEKLFQSGLRVEREDPVAATVFYRKALVVDPRHVSSHVNLGTLLYNAKEWFKAEQHYLQAIAIDPKYAVAWFDLANVYDEVKDPGKAVLAYKTALELQPDYADAHYNLALTYSKNGECRKALKHWRAYGKLDTTGPWHDYATKKIKEILASENLKIVYRNPNRR